MTCDRPVSVEDDHPGVDRVVERTRPDDGRQLIDAQLVRQRNREQRRLHGRVEIIHAEPEQVLDPVG